MAVANANRCGYCNAAHSFISEKLVNIDILTIEKAREGKADDARSDAALAFTRTLIEKHGRVSDADVLTLRNGGFNDAAITEIVGHVGLNILTNYFNNTALTKIDFPEVTLAIEAAVI